MVRLARARRRLLATLASAPALFFAEPARAFERQWHVGGGLGAASASASEGAGFGMGLALGLHGAYGISDVFDARLELQGSRHDVGGIPVSMFLTRAGLAYKLDVLEWIPYVGGSAGAFGVVWDEGATIRPCAGGFAGLDYAVSRHVGVGVFVALDYVFANPNLIAGTGLVRGEYRFGW
jgi:hypothetical protein